MLYILYVALSVYWKYIMHTTLSFCIIEEETHIIIYDIWTPHPLLYNTNITIIYEEMSSV